MLIYKLTSIVRTSSNLTKDVPLSYEAAVLFLNHYRTLECRGVLFIEQDDSAGLATIRQLVERSPKGPRLCRSFLPSQGRTSRPARKCWRGKSARGTSASSCSTSTLPCDRSPDCSAPTPSSRSSRVWSSSVRLMVCMRMPALGRTLRHVVIVGPIGYARL